MNTSMNIDALESAAGQVSGISGNFSSELSSLGSLVQSNKEYWNDPAQAAFETKYEQFRASMTQFIEALNNYSTAMRQYAAGQRDLQASAARGFDGI